MESKIDELENLENKLAITQKVTFYEGVEEVRNMYEKILVSDYDNFRAFFNPDLVKKIMPEYFYGVANKIKENKKTARELLIYSENAEEYRELFSSEVTINHISKGVVFFLKKSQKKSFFSSRQIKKNVYNEV